MYFSTYLVTLKLKSGNHAYCYSSTLNLVKILTQKQQNNNNNNHQQSLQQQQQLLCNIISHSKASA